MHTHTTTIHKIQNHTQTHKHCTNHKTNNTHKHTIIIQNMQKPFKNIQNHTQQIQQPYTNIQTTHTKQIKIIHTLTTCIIKQTQKPYQKYKKPNKTHSNTI